jgi:AcrR family transcriptional regulator
MSSTNVDGRRARGQATRELILRAARTAIAEDGYAGTTTRAVAERAGVRLSLVHYHFGGKQQLLRALLEHENERLLERQRALYAGPESLAEKWLRACDYLVEDLRSGYVRVLWELWAIGLAEPDLAAHWREAITSWLGLLEGVTVDWAAEQDLELPMSPRAVTALVASAFLGAEALILAGIDEKTAPNLEALRSCAKLIERLETVDGPARVPS